MLVGFFSIRPREGFFRCPGTFEEVEQSPQVETIASINDIIKKMPLEVLTERFGEPAKSNETIIQPPENFVFSYLHNLPPGLGGSLADPTREQYLFTVDEDTQLIYYRFSHDEIEWFPSAMILFRWESEKPGSYQDVDREKLDSWELKRAGEVLKKLKVLEE